MLSSLYGSELDLWGFHLSRPNLRSLSLRPDDLLTILKMASSIGSEDSVSLLSAIQATRLLTVASVGLSPTDHASLSWTHFRTVSFPQYGFKAGMSDGACPYDTQSSVARFAFVLRAPRFQRRIPRTVPRDAARLSTTVQAAFATLPQGP